MSDPVMRVPALDERMDDLNAVLDAVGVDRPALLGVSEGVSDDSVRGDLSGAGAFACAVRDCRASPRSHLTSRGD